jgi:hypothetical protein
MSVTINSITTANQGQFVPVNPNTAEASITFTNLSNDIVVVAYDGQLASYSHGYRIAPGGNITISCAAAAAGNGLAFPAGPISFWGPAAGQAFSVSIDQ